MPVLTLDGPGGAGKGTVAIAVAEELGWRYLDSGALYRILGLLAEEAGIPSTDEQALAALAGGMTVSFFGDQVFVGDRNVESLIRTEQVGNRASRIASLAGVRKALLDWQRNCAISPGLVADGRDMGTVVFPDAVCKIFLTASAEERAQRRFNQLRLKGFDVKLHALFEEILERDRRDENRSVSPLKPATDAILLDTTSMTIEQVVGQALVYVRKAIGDGGETT